MTQAPGGPTCRFVTAVDKPYCTWVLTQLGAVTSRHDKRNSKDVRRLEQPSAARYWLGQVHGSRRREGQPWAVLRSRQHTANTGSLGAHSSGDTSPVRIAIPKGA